MTGGKTEEARTDGGTETGGTTFPGSESTVDDGPTADDSPMADYEMSNYFPKAREFTEGERKRLRTHYGWVRSYFKTRPQRYATVQRWLNQARIGTTYDQYLTGARRSTWMS